MTETKFKFHSSVNSIPVIRPSAATSKNATSVRNNGSNELSSFLADSTPVTLDYFAADTFSGEMRLTIETMTALVFGEQDRSEGQPREIELQIDPTTGRPIIPATMIKGMIANAYERMTASRFRVFGDHSDTLTYRADPAAANNLIPIRLDSEYESGTHRGTLLYGPNNARFAKVYTFDGSRKLNTNLEIKHNNQVWFQAVQIDSTYVVTAIWDDERSTYKRLELPKKIAAKITQDNDADSRTDRELNTRQNMESGYKGWFYATTPDDLLKTNERIFSTKNSERIFFDDSSSQPKINIQPEIAATYDRVILSYAYNSEKGARRPKNASRFVHERNNSGLTEEINHNGLLAYARLDSDNTIIEILPTEVGRRNYPCAPRDLAKAQQILPASKADEASPADRLFGFTAEQIPDTTSNTAALKGRITISSVSTDGVQIQSRKRPVLHPLLSPKESSARRFLTDSNGKLISGRDRPRYYSMGDMLGAAAYPFRSHDLESRDGFLKRATYEHYKDSISDNNIDTSNIRVQTHINAWIPSKQTFDCTLRFERLSTSELRTLILIVNSEQLGAWASGSHSKQTAYLRMGTGKALGLGIVKVDCREYSIYRTFRQDTDHWGLVDDYRDLDGCFGAPSELLADANSGWDYHSFIEQAQEFYRLLAQTVSAKAFMRSCIGYSDEHPVRYMHLNENKWNNETDNNSGRSKKGHALAPTSLADDNWEKPMSVGRRP